MEIEKRKHPRTPIDPLEITIEEIWSSRGMFHNISLIILDVSWEGVRFSSDLEFEVEDHVQLNLPSIGLTSMVFGRIAWRRESERHGFEYGLQILNSSEDGSV